MALTAGSTVPPIAEGGRRPTNFPWLIQNNFNGDDLGAFAVGGSVIVLTAGAALNIGDAVYGSAAFTVNKSTTSGNQVLRIGVVVGPILRSVEGATLEVLQRLTASGGDIGLQAAATGQAVLICNSGICYAVIDSAGALTAWQPVKLSTTTSGSVTGATANTDAGKIIGYAVDANAGTGGIISRIMIDLG